MYTFDLNLIRIFVAVAEHGTLTRAGDPLGYRQAAVSQQMQKLETQIDLPLLRRDGWTKRLTDGGMQLQRYARNDCPQRTMRRRH